MSYDAWIKINGCDFCLSHLDDEKSKWCPLCKERWIKDTNMDINDLLNCVFVDSSFIRCPSCGLQGEQRDCPKCGRKACDKCIAIDNSDCMIHTYMI